MGGWLGVCAFDGRARVRQVVRACERENERVTAAARARERNMEAGAAFNFLRAICVDHICYNGSA
jgi:hypothetical protein